MARVLVFRPLFDLATTYGNAWLGVIADRARALGHEVMDLSGEAATKEAFFSALETFRPEIVIACSHGSPTLFTSQGGEVALQACRNDDVMAGTQAYFVSCLVGQELLPSMNEKDARVVAGYTAEFVWVIHPGYSDRPLEDPYARPFMRAVVEPTAELLAGASWRQWYDRTVAMFNRGIAEWFGSEDPNAPQIVAALEHDRDSLVVYGEVEARPAARLVAARIPLMFVPPLLLGAIIVGMQTEKP